MSQCQKDQNKQVHIVCLCVCLFVRLIVCFLFVYLFVSSIFHLYGDVTITGEGLQILTYARHSWPFSSVASFTCHTYCDTAHPFIMVISEDPWHSHLLPNVKEWSCHYLFLRRMPVTAGIRPTNLSLAGPTL